MTEHVYPFTIAGSGGKGGRQRTPKEAPDSLRSRQVARVIDLLSEGPVKGLVGGQRGVFVDGVALENKDGTTNYDSFSIQQNLGYPNQPIMSGFPSASQENAVNVELTYNDPIVRSILNTDVDRCRITVSVPALQQTYPKSGDTKGTKVSYRIEVSNNSGGFRTIGTYTIDGKTSSRYQRAVTFALPRPGPWQLRVIRTTSDSTSQLLQNETYWDSYTAITDDRVNYANSAVIGILIDSEQFSSIPKRVFLVDGMLCKIPKNYNPVTHVYTGVWDGKFNFDWTDNPAWVFYDLLTNNRYGLGQYISSSLIDKWSLYNIARYCDELVPNGHGGSERRYSCNIQIRDQQEAFDLLQRMASVFHGWVYWGGNTLKTGADMPADPTVQFSNANVIDGVFTYSGNEKKSRHTVASVSWADPQRLGDARITMVEDQAMMARFGIQRVDIEGVGITVEGQAQRTGAWAIYGEQYEGEVVNFKTSFEGNIAPGTIIQIADITIAGKRRGGRVAAGSTVSSIQLDGDPSALGAGSKFISLYCTDGVLRTVATTRVTSGETGVVWRADLATPLPSPPLLDGLFVISEVGRLEPTLWRVREVSQSESNIYEIVAVRHLPSKYGYIERARPLVIPDISDISIFPPAVTGLKIVEYMIATSPVSVGVRGTLSWASRAPNFDLVYRDTTGNWTRLRTDHQAHDFPATEGPFEFQVTPVGVTGMKGATASLKYTFIGRFALPEAPKQFRINVVNGIAMFDWLPAEEIDVIIGGHYELRFTTRTSGATWTNAQTVIPSIPGASTHAEIAYQPGTWMLRTYDITGRASKTWAIVEGVADDSGYFAWVRICENPTWLGTHHNTKIQGPGVQDWLIIDKLNGGLIDTQTNLIDTWEDIDSLPSTAGGTSGVNTGVYDFKNMLDVGGLFSIRLSADLLAFPFEYPTAYIDDRSQVCDQWQDWDDSGQDLQGEAIIMISTTLDNPTLPTPDWGDWKTFIAGEHYGWAHRFQLVLIAPYGENIAVETACILGDFRNKFDEGMDVPYAAAAKTVTFAVKFFNEPSIVVNVQNDGGTGTVADKVVISNKTTTSFRLTVTNGGAAVTRTFDWHAQGY